MALPRPHPVRRSDPSPADDTTGSVCVSADRPIRAVVVGDSALARRIDDAVGRERGCCLASHCTTIAQACEVTSVQPIDVVLVEAAYARAASEDLLRALRTHRIRVLLVGDA